MVLLVINIEFNHSSSDSLSHCCLDSQPEYSQIYDILPRMSGSSRLLYHGCAYSLIAKSRRNSDQSGVSEKILLTTKNRKKQDRWMISILEVD